MRCPYRIHLLLGALLLTGSAWANESAALRIGFLLNFTRFVDWPEARLKADAPLRICLAPGDGQMTLELEEVARKATQDRPITVRQLARPVDAKGCHVVYFPAETPGTMSPWLDAAQQTGALTVGDLPDFTEAGGMIGLVPVSGRYRFNINLGVARQADLRMSSQLLKLAGNVK